VVFNKAFVAVWIGPQFYAGRMFDGLIAISLISTIFAITVSKVLFAIGDIKGPVIAEIIQHVSRLILVFFLVWVWAINGAALSMAITAGGAVIFYFTWRYVRVLQISTVEFCAYLLSFGKALVISVASSCVFVAFVVRNNWIWFIGPALISLLLTTGLIYIFDKQFRAEIAPLQIKAKSGFARVRN
jgi:peptidoglycan biosynthesis protein MviN/MurJ (putative lipid II flippase)